MFKIKLAVLIILFSFFFSPIKAGDPSYKIALLKYNGGGDWYANLETSVKNLILFCNKNLNTNISPEQGIVEAGSPELFNYPFVHMTGHGNVVFNAQEAQNLRNYLTGGGFLHISDNYGMDEFIRREFKKVFPEISFVEIPFTHPVYHQQYDFPNGLPKIHEHDGGRPQGLGLFYHGRLVCFYDYDCDLGDGWEDPDVHHDPEDKRQQALKMGANLLMYAFSN